MDAAQAYERMLLSMLDFWRGVAAASAESSVIEGDGILAAVVPSAPSRSFFNSVLYEDPVALPDRLDELAAAYGQAGVAAWTVWVPRDHAETAELLEGAGHKHDAQPRMMVLEDLESVEPSRLEGVEWTRDPDPREFGLVCDRAFGIEGEGFLQAVDDRLEIPDAHLYLAQHEGEPAATAMIIDRDGDAGVFAIATDPAAQGKGLATALVCQALCDARERGCETSTLQATKRGFPIYERLGYTNHGPIDMWERRKPR
ncbi:MAG: GNAT family N-acetyltransferase [Solirubrobacterales bacterium]